MKQYLCIGSYTEPILFGTGEVFQGKGLGLSICSFEDGKIEKITEIPVRNPSFLCMDEKKKKIYTVNEMKEYLGAFGGGVTQIAYDDAGNMTIEKTFNTGGTDPCHIELSPDGSFISIANFASGSVTIFPVDEKGDLTGESTLFRHEGSSVHPIRQKGPHAHSTIFTPDGQKMYVPDLGIDMVKAYTYGAGNAEPDPANDLRVEPGNGPRAGEFSKDGKHFYLIDEIGCNVVHFSYENGVMTAKEQVNTLPDGYEGNNICSDLHITADGKYLIASNRGHDSLVSFKIEEDGSLTLLDRTACGGKTPRNFSLDRTGHYILCGNQDSDYITVFEIQDGGKLVQGENYQTGSPVCIRFFNNF